MKVPDMKIVEEAMIHQVAEHGGEFYRLSSDDQAATPEIEVLCPLCQRWCTAVLRPAQQEDEDHFEFMVPIGINLDRNQPYRLQLHVDITAHVHDHECNPTAFVEAEEGSFGDY